MNSNDNATRSHADVPWVKTGVGHYSAAKCEARKGYFLCGASISRKGYCRECSEARAARELKVAA